LVSNRAKSKTYDTLNQNLSHAKSILPDDKPEGTVLTSSQISAYRHRLNLLNSINFPDISQINNNPSSVQLRTIKEWQELNVRRKQLEEQLGSYNISQDSGISEDVSQQLDSERRKLHDLQQIAGRRKMLEDQLNTAIVTLQGIVLEPNLKIELEALKTKNQQDIYNLSEIKYARQMNDMFDAIKRKEQMVIATGMELEDIHKLRAKAVDVECRKLDQVIDSINNSMNDILTDIFDDPIRVNLQLYRELKSKKNQFRQQINVSIDYRGSQCDNINQMSGGEGDRISFALIFALNQISGSPVLLLDESMASLDGELRTKALDSLKHHMCNTKTIVLIDHEGTEGIFDEVIPFI